MEAASHPAVPRQRLLGVGVSVLDMDLALEELARLRTEGNGGYVCVTPAHSLMDCVQDEQLRRIYNDAAMVTPDGMGVVWLLHLWGHKRANRVYGPDLMLAAMDHGRGHGWTHYLLGGRQSGLERLQSSLIERYPGLRIAGCHAPPFRALSTDEESRMRAAITESGADFVWVALGSPRQERWMAGATADLPASVLLGVGAAFDFVSGDKAQAPRWIQRCGLEWLFRLATEPRRLWPRYRLYPRFLLLASLELLRDRRAKPS